MGGWREANSHAHEIVLFNLSQFDVSANADFSSDTHGSMLLVFTVRFTLPTVCFAAALELALVGRHWYQQVCTSKEKYLPHLNHNCSVGDMVRELCME